MALDTAAFVDLRNFIRRRIGFLRYRTEEAFYKVPISDAQVLSDGTVRVAASIVPDSSVTINRVELYNNNGDLWAHQECNITIDHGQTGILYWFDFTIKEGTT